MKAATLHTRRLTLPEALLVIVVVVFAFAMFFPMLPSRPNHKALQVKCAGNLKMIGLALLMYSGDYDGYFPQARPNSPPHNNFDTLVKSGLLANGEVAGPYMDNGKVWACPGRRDVLTLASNSSYRYIGSGIKDDNARATATSLAYDEWGNHRKNGWMNVLFIDGHVEGGRPGTVPWTNN